MSAVQQSRFSTEDPDAATEVIHRTFGSGRISPSPDRRLSWKQTTLSTEDVVFAHLDVGGEAEVRVEELASPSFVAVRGAGRFGYTAKRAAHELDSDGALLIAPRRDMVVELGPVRYDGVQFASGALERILGEAFPGSTLQVSQHQALSGLPGRYWRSVQASTSQLLGSEQLSSHELLREESIRHLFMATIHAFGMAQLTVASPVGERAVRRAAHYIDDHLDQPMTVEDLAAHANVTVRGLQAAFQRVLGVTPMSYVRRARLDAVREEFLAADPAATTVRAVALRWGFRSGGHFAALYRDAFGVSPRDTLGM